MTRYAQTAAEAWARFASGGEHRVIDEREAFGFIYGGFVVFDSRGQIWDRRETREAAEKIARELNTVPAEMFASGDPIDGLDTWETDGGFIPVEAPCATS